ncbi:UDP-4-amino-4-deoxy-L-arabinose--oxoglutarate aminotransferase [Gemmata obscuriglobus]|nr:DegT/DnrJ/EryC1/StrS family aminotransferase [Gemmata obscuriglobus]QEG30826.1 UDP-4-amino-4-deoxy-L-arabinose--oxoglutarate aminotransferase [Gemmata obscuriglobus]VTS10157.1 cdp-4-keto-6-deoxy-d-glucose-3-dehydrase : DegT/DnrJ/EryC1/StrS aminotransferase family protein OS=Nitrospina gracilis (strain 3/211) GN=NITGR_170046 PE=3 SV=1: DegT_DnrJ_EryC1 [Gemmata obscuriglobus UQM 2246]
MPSTKPAAKLNWPLMKNNIAREDLNAVIELLQQEDPILTQSKNVRAFEAEWSQWLGVKHSVFVNSGSSANLVTIAALKELHGAGGEVIVPAITWVSDISAVLHCGFTPVFADINPRTLSMDTEQILSKITPQTRAVFLTHVLGYNGLTDKLLTELKARGIPLIEDVCESHGATFRNQKLGSFGWASNFSFYYAHHLSTIEGGMVCTDDEDLYEAVRMMRGHGMVRELAGSDRKAGYFEENPDLNPDFIFAFPAYNVRSTEVNAVIGRSQLPRLDANNEKRTANFMLFLRNLDPDLYRTDFDTEGSSNYAFTLVLKEPNQGLYERVVAALRGANVEFRRGTAGGGNQLRQPYLRRLLGDDAWKQCPIADHVHFYGFYIGNYPTLDADSILKLCDLLNGLK